MPRIGFDSGRKTIGQSRADNRLGADHDRYIIVVATAPIE